MPMTRRLSEPHFNLIILNEEPSTCIFQILKSYDKTKCLKSAKLEFSNCPHERSCLFNNKVKISPVSFQSSKHSPHPDDKDRGLFNVQDGIHTDLSLAGECFRTTL